jgi:hypothetical protein
MKKETLTLDHGGTIAFGDRQDVVAVAEFDFDAVDEALDKSDPEIARMLRLEDFNHVRARRAAARLMRKGGCGRRGLPADIVQQMYRDYMHLGSLSKVGKLYKRTRQSMWEIFRSSGLKMNERKFHAKILFEGRSFTPGKDGYYRESSARKNIRLLHYAIWEKASGKKCPPGWQVFFKDGDNTNFRSRNLDCLPIAEVTLHHYRRRFPHRAHLTREQNRERIRKHGRDYMALRSLKNLAKGLRTDGKPFRRKGPR